MKDTDLYTQILGLSDPWFVQDVKLDTANQRVDVIVKHEKGIKWSCPKCNKQLGIQDHAEERTWRHLDTCQFKTFLKARIPRVKCPDHGVLQVKTPWAEERSRFTLLMERFAIDIIKRAQNTTAACDIMKMSWDEVWGIMERAVKRGKIKKKDGIVKKVGVDEKSFKGGHGSYMTLVYDIENSSVNFITEDRKADSLDKYFKTLSKEQIQGIEAVSADMWDPYLKSIKANIPNAENKIVLDRFHVMKLVNTALDEVRRKEQAKLPSEEKSVLKGSRYALLYGEENLPEFYGPKLEARKASNLKVARAWAMKESIRNLWEYVSVGWAKKFFKGWYWWATHSRLKPMIKLAKTLKRYLNYIVSHARHQISNGVAEGLNSKIMSIKRRACGFRNGENYKTAIYFYCGRLDLYPH